MMDGVYRDAIPDLGPGNSLEVRRAGHVMHVTATKHTGLYSGRRCYAVECLTCKTEIHPATTGPAQNIERHVADSSDLTTATAHQVRAASGG